MAAIAERGPEVLRGPAARVRAITGVADALATGRLSLGTGDDWAEQRAALLAMPGIGPWTAELVLLRALGEPDAFPSGDLVLRRMAGDGSPLTARALDERAEHWRPWRGYAVMHLWRSASDLR
jgi:AraC family transcriptional regulator of adaptative response / DNA-3-methyladenine glycosylase II